MDKKMLIHANILANEIKSIVQAYLKINEKELDEHNIAWSQLVCHASIIYTAFVINFGSTKVKSLDKSKGDVRQEFIDDFLSDIRSTVSEVKLHRNKKEQSIDDVEKFINDLFKK